MKTSPLTQVATGTSILMLGMAICSIWGLQSYGFWGDDAFHLELAHNFSGWIDHSRRDSHPALYYLYLQAAVDLFGLDSPVGLRLPGIVLGLAAVAGAAALGWRLTQSVVIALAFAALTALSPLMIEQSQTIRNYSLMMCLLFPMMLLVTKTKFDGRTMTLAMMVTVLACLSHYSAVIVAACTGFWGCIRIWQTQQNTRRLIYLGVWCSVHLGAAYAVYFLSRLTRFTSQVSNLELAPSASALEIMAALQEILRSQFVNADWPIGLMLAALAITGCFQMLRSRRWDLLFIALGPVVLGIAMSAVNLYPLKASRWSLYLLPAFLLMMCWPLTALTARHQRYAASALIITILLGNVNANESIFKPDSLRGSIHWTEPTSKLEPLRKHLEKVRDEPLIVSESLRRLTIAEGIYQQSWSGLYPILNGAKPCKIYDLNPSLLPRLCDCVAKLPRSTTQESGFVNVVTLGRSFEISPDAASCTAGLEQISFGKVTVLRIPLSESRISQPPLNGDDQRRL